MDKKTYAQIRTKDLAEIDSNRSSNSFEMLNELSLDSCEASPISMALKREEYKKRVLQKYEKGIHNEVKHFPNTDDIHPHSKQPKLYTKASRPNIPKGNKKKYLNKASHLDDQPKRVEIVITPEMYAKKEPVVPRKPTVIPKEFIEDTSEVTPTHKTMESPPNDITPTNDSKEEENIEEKKESEVLEQPLLVEEPIVDLKSEDIRANFMEILVNSSSTANMLKAVVHK